MQKEIGGMNSDIPLTTFSDGVNFFIGGRTKSLGFGTDDDAFLLKLNSNGQIISEQVFGEIQNDDFVVEYKLEMNCF